MAKINNLEKLIVNGDRVALAQAITLVESQLPQDRQAAGELISSLLKYTGNSIRIGITGVPGVGKSTFIEALGLIITKIGKKLAVLAIDPSSPSSKGSILGDKTRMNALAANKNAFVRPSSAGNNLGGVASRSMESVLLCEAAGYDVIIIETVGVGQSEFAVKNMSDVFLLLMLAGAGDELQGIKRGIMEIADILVINKADGDNVSQANLARKAYESAIHLFTQRETKWQPPVLTCSSLSGNGVEVVWDNLIKYIDEHKANGHFEISRKTQKKYWLDQALSTEILQHLKNDQNIKNLLPELEDKVLSNQISSIQAVEQIMKIFLQRKN